MPEAVEPVPQVGLSPSRVFRVTVAVCTYRRPEQLLILLRSIAQQELPRHMTCEVLVVDNSPAFEAKAVVRDYTTDTPVRYVAHGAGNIASGRNAALEHVPDGADFVAFIDDDEVADPQWLHKLVLAHCETGADVVTGPVLASYPASTPAWLRCDAFFSVGGPMPGAFVDEAVTGNALIQMSAVRRLGLTFDATLGSSGGEDQLFFRTARALGAKIWFEPLAIVQETVPPSRLSLRYLLRREYRKGNTLGLLDRSRPGWPAGRPGRRLASAGYWSFTGLAAAIVGALQRDRQAAAAGLLRIARSLGMIAGLGGATFQHYGDHALPQRGGVLALVVQEDPAYQQAGHSHYLQSYVDHYEGLGMTVLIVVTEGRLGFLVRRKGTTVYRAPGLVDVLGVQLAVHPRLVARWLAWATFRAAPRAVQVAADRGRTVIRHRRSVDHHLGQLLNTGQVVYLTRLMGRERPTAVLFSSPFSVPRPLQLPDSVMAAGLICHDVVSDRAADLRARGYLVTPADFDAQHEAAAMLGMTTVIAIQWDDAEVFRNMAPPPTEILVCPVSVSAGTLPHSPEADRCLFVGSGSLPNVDGLRWFLDNCWSSLRLVRPSARLHVVGTVCARIGPVPPGVVLLGEVADLEPEYAQASVVVVPLQAGSGLKVKIVEALTRGVAVVTTSVGGQGLTKLDPVPFLLADGPADFAAEVARVLTDAELRIRLEQSSEHASALFTAQEAFSDLDDHLFARGALNPRPSVP